MSMTSQFRLRIVYGLLAVTALAGSVASAGGLHFGRVDVGGALKQIDPTNRDSAVSHATGSVIDTDKFRILPPPPSPQGSTFTDPDYEAPHPVQYIPDGEDIFLENRTNQVADFHVWAVPRGSNRWVQLKPHRLGPNQRIGQWTVPWKDGIATSTDGRGKLHYQIVVESWSTDGRQLLDRWYDPAGIPAQRAGFRTRPSQDPNARFRRPWVEFILTP
jgi:hypothetical protein